MTVPTACIIPARGGSKGIPKKNLKDLFGKPLLAWSIEHALASKRVNGQVYVSSDSQEILDVAEKCGAHAIVRPPEISTDTASSEAAIEHAILEVEKSLGSQLQNVVFLQATSPLRQPDDIDRAIDQLEREKADSLFSAQPLLDYFIWKKSHGTAESTNFDYKNRKRRQDLEKTFLENGSIYVFKRWVLFEKGNRLGGKISIYEMDRARSIQVDNDEDLELCRFFCERGLP